jgi:hypothetical protein
VIFIVCSCARIPNFSSFMFHAEDSEKTVIGMPYGCFKSSSLTAVSISLEYYQK